MSKLRRYVTENATFFITAVTHGRTPFLAQHSDVFLEALNRQSSKHNAKIHAWVILPDHFHLLIELDGTPLPKFIQSLKLSFTNMLRVKGFHHGGRFWQLRYWDHVIRDQTDFNAHFDYIHYNPVKHGIADSPFDYEFSSAREYLNSGVYTDDWGAGVKFQGDFGE